MKRLTFPFPLFLILAGIPVSATAAAPASPANLRAWPVSASAIQLEWQDQASDETSYEVQRETGRSGIWVTLVDPLPADSTGHLDAGLEADTVHQYRVLARNADGAASSGLARAITDNQPFGTRSLTFQNGSGGYNGAYDIGINQTEPSSNSQAAYVWVDNNGPAGDNQALVHFSGLFGSVPDRIPVGTAIHKAVLRLYLGSNSNSQSYKSVSFHQMLVPWDSGTTWGSAGLGGNGVQIDDGEARAGYDAIQVFGMPDYTYELDVTPTLQAWMAGEPQHGWLIRTGWSDGYAYYTTHNFLPGRRPELVVSFDSDPANRHPVVGAALRPGPGATGIHGPTTVELEVRDPDGDPLEVVLFGREAPLGGEPDFTVVLLPDTQNYAAEINGATRNIFYRQADWIVGNREALNIPFVLHMGDIVQSGDIKGSAHNGAEWLIAAQALYRLHRTDTTGLPEGIPFAVNVGNHDQQPRWRSSGESFYYNQYFGVNHFSRFSYYGGHYGGNNDNHYYLFKAGSYEFIVISLEYSDPALDPLDTALLEWADALLKAYPDHRGIVISHHMVNPGTPAAWSPYGEAIYEVLKDNPNLHLMLGGHVTGEGLRIDTHGDNTVYSLVQDYQGLSEGGAGYLRLLRFSPRLNEIRLDTYSPWLDQYLGEFGGAFSLPYDLGTVLPPFAEIARFQDVASGALLGFPWQGLRPGTAYEWYVEARDGRKSARSEPAVFRSAARTYESWKADHFAAGDPAGAAAADPDEDGFDNFLEFVFSGIPTEAAALRIAPGPVAINTGATELAYQRLRDVGLAWQVEVSRNLSSWLPAGLAGVGFGETVTDNGDGSESVRVSVEIPPHEPLYWRIAAQRAGPP